MEAKEKLRKRAVERKRQIRLEEEENQIARERAAERFTAMEKELEERKAKLEELDEETKKKESALLRVAEKSKDIDFGILGFATAENKDELQEIKGIGPFIEEKLNALGIFTFAQISRMTSELEEKVNEAIEFFPGESRETNGRAKQGCSSTLETMGEPEPLSPKTILPDPMTGSCLRLQSKISGKRRSLKRRKEKCNCEREGRGDA